MASTNRERGGDGDGIDPATVRRAQRGDPRALDAVVRGLMPYLGRICGAIALDQGDDALQETLIAVTRHLSSLREPAAVWGWARRIAVREALRQVGARDTVPVDPVALDARRVVGGAGAGAGETGVEIRDVLARLDPAQRAVLVLGQVEGLSEAETAEVLGIPTGTVKSRLSRARRAFRERWAQ